MAEDKIGHDDLFDFSDETPLHKGLQGIDRLERAYEAFVKQSAQQSKVLREEMNTMATAVKQLSQALQQADVSTRKSREEAGRMAAQLHKQSQQFSALKGKLQEQVNKTRELSKAHRELQKSYNTLSKARQKASADANRIATKEAEAQIAIARKEAEQKLAIARKQAEAEIRLEEGRTKAAQREAERRIADARREAREKTKAAEREAAQLAARGDAGSIADLRYRRQEAITAMERMGPTIDPQLRRNQAREVFELTRALREQEGAFATARKGAMAARDSYAGLVAENARLARQLREMDDAFDTATGALNRNNTAAMRMMRQYRQNTEALKRFDAAMGLNYRNVGNYSSALKGAARHAEQFALGLVGQFAGMFALAEATQVAFRSNLELSDAQASVQKTVGMTKAEVDALSEAFKTIDTRTTLVGLMDIAKIGGQFGVAEKDIAGFTEATNKAAVALSDEFKGGVEEVATELYTLRGLFADTSEMSPEDAMMRIGSAINSLGASGAATGPVVAEFTKRLGQLGTMGPSIQTALGLGAALQELGLSAEIASGGYSNIIIQLKQTKNAVQAAKYLGMTTDAFKEMLANNPNDLLLEMAEKLDGNVEQMRKFGVMSQESIKVWSTMGTNADRVRELIALANDEFERGTSINREYAVVNENLAASWEKLINRMKNAVTSGEIGGWLKGVVDTFRASFDNIDRFMGRFRGGDLATQAAKHTEALHAEHEAMNQALITFDRLTKQQVLSAEESVALNQAILQLKVTLGDNAVEIDKETKAWRLNAEAVRKGIDARNELSKNSSDFLKQRYAETSVQLRATSGRRQDAQNNLSLLESQFSPLAVEDAKESTTIGFYQKITRYTEDQQEKLKMIRSLHQEITELKEKEARLEKDREESMRRALALGMDLEKWYRKEQGRARVLATHGGPQNPDKPTLVPDPNAISDEEKARLEKMREAAAEARHQLAILQQQIRTMQAEWVKLSATDLEWKMPDVPDGWSEQLGFVEGELDEINRMYDAQAMAIRAHVAEQVKDAQLAAQEKLRHNEAGADGVRLIEQELQRDLEVIRRQGDAEMQAAIQRRIKAEKDAASDIAKINKKSQDERARVAKEYMDRARQADEADASGFWKRRDEQADAWEDFLNNIPYALAEMGGEIGQAYFQIRQNRLDQEMAYLQYMHQQELEAAGDNEELKAQLQTKYAKQELKLRQEQAKNQKKQAVFSVLLATAMAVMNALASPAGPPATWIMAAITGAMGAAQLAAVMSTPIPKFYRGVQSAPEGPAQVAESGPELAISPEGRLVRYDKPQVAFLEKGTQVKTAAETRAFERQLREAYGQEQARQMLDGYRADSRQLARPAVVQGPGYWELLEEMRLSRRQTLAELRKKRETHYDGGVRRERDGEVWRTYVNQKYYRG